MKSKYQIACATGLLVGLVAAFCVPEMYFHPSNSDSDWHAPHFKDLALAQRPEVIALGGIANLLIGLKNLLERGLWFLGLPPAILCGQIKLEELGKDKVWAWALGRSICVIAMGDYCVSALWGFGCCGTDTDVVKYWPYELWYGVQATVFLIWCSFFSLIAPIAWMITFAVAVVSRRAAYKR